MPIEVLLSELPMDADESFLAGIPASQIRVLFAEAAVRAGVIRPGDPLDEMQVDFATEIVTLCARLVDRIPRWSEQLAQLGHRHGSAQQKALNFLTAGVTYTASK